MSKNLYRRPSSPFPSNQNSNSCTSVSPTSSPSSNTSTLRPGESSSNQSDSPYVKYQHQRQKSSIMVLPIHARHFKLQSLSGRMPMSKHMFRRPWKFILRTSLPYFLIVLCIFLLVKIIYSPYWYGKSNSFKIIHDSKMNGKENGKDNIKHHSMPIITPGYTAEFSFDDLSDEDWEQITFTPDEDDNKVLSEITSPKSKMEDLEDFQDTFTNPNEENLKPKLSNVEIENPKEGPILIDMDQNNGNKLVDKIAQDKAKKRREKLIRKSREVDIKYCGISPCRFLFPVRIGEQESKAQVHLLQLAQLAQELERILVLPNIQQGRLGGCRKFGFGQYFEEDSLEKLGYKTITQSQFLMWSRERRLPATGQISIVDTRSDGSDRSWNKGGFHIELDNPPTFERMVHCLDRYHLNWSKHELFPIIYEKSYSGNQRQSEAFASTLIKAYTQHDLALGKPLTKEEAMKNGKEIGSRDLAEVLALHTDFRYPFMDIAKKSFNPYNSGHVAPLTYSKKWTKLAKSLSEHMNPYIAVHWRMELVPSENLPECAKILVETIKSISSKNIPNEYKNIKLQTVYLATDYPLEDPYGGRNGIRHSGTFYPVDENHHQSIKILKEGLKENNMRLTTMLLEIEKKNGEIKNSSEEIILGNHTEILPSEELILGNHTETLPSDIVDPGLLGIIDKMIATRSQIFISGKQGCARKSSFSRQIINERKANLKGGNITNLWNDVYWWGEDK